MAEGNAVFLSLGKAWAGYRAGYRGARATWIVVGYASSEESLTSRYPFMTLQCPQCQTKYRMEEKQFAGRSEVKVRCTKCGTSFAAKRGAGAGETPSSIPEATVVSERGGELGLPADKNVALSVIRGPLKGKVFHISKPRVVLGRADADIVVDDPEISRKHCALEVQGIIARLIDLGSRNGTFVNEKRVEMSELQNLSEFHIGRNTFLFTITDKT